MTREDITNFEDLIDDANQHYGRSHDYMNVLESFKTAIGRAEIKNKQVSDEKGQTLADLADLENALDHLEKIRDPFTRSELEAPILEIKSFYELMLHTETKIKTKTAMGGFVLSAERGEKKFKIKAVGFLAMEWRDLFGSVPEPSKSENDLFTRVACLMIKGLAPTDVRNYLTESKKFRQKLEKRHSKTRG